MSERVVIVGAGVVGTTSAWELLKAGYDVTVIDAAPNAALGTSFGNAGQLTPSLAAPWATPSFRRDIWRYAIRRSGPVLLSRLPDIDMLRFLGRMYGVSTRSAFDRSRDLMLSLARYSLAALRETEAETEINFSHRTGGINVLLRTSSEIEAYREEERIMAKAGIRTEFVPPEQLLALEPALRRDRFKGALRLIEDETGDCRAFTQALAKHCEKRGVRFLFNTTVDKLITERSRITAVGSTSGEIECDRLVLACGPRINELLGKAHARLPVYPVKGYGLTIEDRSGASGPTSSVIDVSNKVSITSYDGFVRVVGFAELAGFKGANPEARFEALARAIGDCFPAITPDRISSASRWHGFRPVTPRGPPIIRRLRFDNMFVNVGHGTLGWTLSSGSAKLLSSLMTGRPCGFSKLSEFTGAEP